MLLTTITHTTHILAMSISLWMAFYLFARGFPNRITLRAVLALFSISIFFLGAYNRFFQSTSHTDYLLAALLVIALICWYSTTFAFFPSIKQVQYRKTEILIYALGIISVLLLVTTKNGEIRNSETLLYTAHLEMNFVNIFYGTTQILTALGVIFNLTKLERTFSTIEGRYYFAISAFLILALGYGILSLTISNYFPRVIEDGLVFGGIFVLGASVARQQSLVERRTIWQDFFIAMFGISGIVFFYVMIYLWLDLPRYMLGNIIALVITTHSIYDLGREAVERWRKAEEVQFRRKSQKNKRMEDEALHIRLNQELATLLEALSAERGLIAIRDKDNLRVLASIKSLEINENLPAIENTVEGVIRVEEKIPGLTWAALAYEGLDPIVLVGVGPSLRKLEYSNGDLEILDEFTEQIGILISINQTLHLKKKTVGSVHISPEIDWTKVVDECLRHFSDYVFLGQSTLAEQVGISAEANIERGKGLQVILREAIQSLRPEGERPPEPLSREWHNYVVLHDAYIKGVPNREVMARLYVSEGTFHRIRRHAIRGIARYLFEKKSYGSKKN